MMYNLSKKDIAFLKRCIKYYSKNSELNEDELSRAKWIPKQLGENQEDKFFSYLLDELADNYTIKRKNFQEIF